MSMHVRTEWTGERGTALVATLLIVSALAVLSIALITFSSTELRIADNHQDSADALYTAEAGVAEAIARLNLRPGTQTVTVNGATFDPALDDDLTLSDPAWRAEIHLADPASLPAPTGTETVAATVQPQNGWLHYGDTAGGLDPIVIEHKWADLDADGLHDAGEIVRYDASLFPPENFATGFPIQVITVPGIVNGARRNVVAEAIRTPVSARAPAAIFSDNVVELTGNMSGCGHNHDLATPVGTKIPGCRAFELCSSRTTDVVSGCQVAVQTTGDRATLAGSSDLEGVPTWSDTSSTNTFLEVWEYLGLSQADWNDVQSSPDYTSANDAVNMDGVVIVNGDATHSEKFNTNDGYGLIYVNGDMDITGNFTWRGFIFVEGHCRITGTAWILGAIAVRGDAVQNSFAAGNSTVLYSREAINLYVGRSVDYRVIGWAER